MSGSDSRDKDSVTEVAEQSFVRARPPEIEKGSVLAGRYQVEDFIGKGGSGIVLRVFDRTAQNVVALKVLKAELAFDAKWDKRFSRELRLGRPIQHRNVCRIFDIGEADGHRFLTMELARGGSLRDELRRTRALDRPIADRLADVRAAIEGLAAIHATGVVHRDFKPDNLLRMEDGRLVISDFGLATDAANAPGATVLIGTPHYMAPEVLAGEPATSRSDVWALGVVIHEICFGNRPERRSVSFDGSGRGPLRPSSSVERAMLALCERCLPDAPLDRPADAGAVVRMFEASTAGRSKTSSTRRGLVPLGVGALVFSALLAFGILHRLHRRPTASAGVADGQRFESTGQPVDWSLSATAIADINGHVHCIAEVDRATVRLIWGTPRRAEDLDLSTGRRHPAPLVPEAFRIGCPELSPNGKALLFTGRTESGTPEIRLSDSPDGRDARAVTSGSDPLWLNGSDEFIYNVDPSHLALFSLPTTTVTLLPEPSPGKHYVIVDKVGGRTGGVFAVLLAGGQADSAVAVYDRGPSAPAKLFPVPEWSRIQFSTVDHSLLVSYKKTDKFATIARLDWKTGRYVNLGHFPGFDSLWLDQFDSRRLLLIRHYSDYVRWNDGSRERRLTTDSEIGSAALAGPSEILLSKRNADGNINIWLSDSAGTMQQVSSGSMDVEPDVAPDGQSWTYADYARKNIMLCGRKSGRCQVFRHDEMLPSWPRFSPDGENIAYLTAVGSPELFVVSKVSGEIRSSWSALYQCPPVWSSSSTLWTLEVSAGRYVWSERFVHSGRRTGKRIDAPNENFDLGEVQCWPPSSTAKDSPLFQHIVVKTSELSRLLRVDGAPTAAPLLNGQ
jgi:hypothetical protein